jgi:hypothetical protein
VPGRTHRMITRRRLPDGVYRRILERAAQLTAALQPDRTAAVTDLTDVAVVAEPQAGQRHAAATVLLILGVPEHALMGVMG